MLETQVRYHLGDTSRFSCLKFMVAGRPVENAETIDEATVLCRIFAQAPTKEAMAADSFLNPCLDICEETYPAATMVLDFRMAEGRRYYEYFVTKLAQTALKPEVHLLNGKSAEKVFSVAHPTHMEPHLSVQPQLSWPLTKAVDEFGPTKKVPLGYVAHGRSGDKGSDANVGLIARDEEEYEWLRAFLTVDRMKQLLGKEYNGKAVERFELPHVHAVHFLLKDHLDRGIASTSSYDYWGKNVIEHVRMRHADVPVKFLERGII